MMLETPRLFLREFREDDGPHLLQLNSDPRVTQFTDMAGKMPDLATIQAIEIPSYRRAYAEAPGLGVFAAIEKETRDFIGWFMLRPYRDAPYFDPSYPFPADTELGYRLKFAAWGRGLASEGVAALLRYGRAELGLDAVMAVVLPENLGSVKVLEKNGLGKLEYGTPGLDFYRLKAK